jgi:hypothetical protein
MYSKLLTPSLNKLQISVPYKLFQMFIVATSTETIGTYITQRLKCGGNSPNNKTDSNRGHHLHSPLPDGAIEDLHLHSDNKALTLTSHTTYFIGGKVRRQNRSVRTATTLQAGQPKNRGSIPREGEFIHSVQIGSWAHLVSYPMGTGDSFPGARAAGA